MDNVKNLFFKTKRTLLKSADENKNWLKISLMKRTRKMLLSYFLFSLSSLSYLLSSRLPLFSPLSSIPSLLSSLFSPFPQISLFFSFSFFLLKKSNNSKKSRFWQLVQDSFLSLLFNLNFLSQYKQTSKYCLANYHILVH